MYNPRIVPSSIYLSHQVDFHSARAIDEFNPLSILDSEARTGRMVFRHEVEAHSAGLDSESPGTLSFDGPLSTALHSIIDAPPDTQLPRLPNGNQRSNWQSAAIPIRHVAVGLGEGVNMVRREYVRAQHIRQKRRASVLAANKLSFEEDVVFPSSGEARFSHPADHSSFSPNILFTPLNSNDEAITSSPSEPPQTTHSESSGSSSGSAIAEATASDPDSDPKDEAVLEGWTEEWEEEYAKAVEDDGAPEELVLGLMDEEEEERRKWVQKRQAMKGDWARQ